jgi:hypothetical protein
MKTPAQKSIETAVNRATRAILATVKLFEEHNVAVEDCAKSFAHLQRAVQAAHRRAHAAVAAKATYVSSFSLDTDEQTAVVIVGNAPNEILSEMPFEEIEAPAIAPAVLSAPEKPKWVKPEGRLAGTKEVVRPTDNKPKSHDAAGLTAEMDNKGLIKDAGFVGS